MSCLVFLLVAVFVFLMAAALTYFERQFRETISAEQFTMISAMADDIDSRLMTAQAQLQAMAHVAPPTLAGHPRQAQTFLAARPEDLAVFDGICLFTSSGTLVAASPEEPQLIGRNYSYREYFKQTVADRRPHISEPFFSTQKHRPPIIMLTAPIFDRRGRIAAVLAGSLDLMKDNFLGKLATMRVGKTGYFYLYGSDRTIIVHPDRSRILKRDVPPGVNRLFDRALAGFEGTGETVNSRGLHALSSFKRLKSTNWILADNYPQSEAYAPIHKAERYLVVALLAVLLISFLIAWAAMEYLTAPLLRFTRHIQEMTGRTDLRNPIPIEAQDEVGTLARAFNGLLEEMERQSKDIRDHQEFSEGLILNSAVPTFVLDGRHRVIFWNKACPRSTGTMWRDWTRNRSRRERLSR